MILLAVTCPDCNSVIPIKPDPENLRQYSFICYRCGKHHRFSTDEESKFTIPDDPLTLYPRFLNGTHP